MAPQPTVKLPLPTLPPVDLGLDADRDLGVFVADTKLHITQSAFSDRYEQGIGSWWQEQGVSEDDAQLGVKAAALMLEGSRRALIRAIARSSVYSAVLVSVCFLVRLPAAWTCFLVPAATVTAICVSKK